jgi:uracil-DNA glycosylase
VSNAGPSLAERGGPAARREEGEYRAYLTDEPRSGRAPQPARRREAFDTSLLGGTRTGRTQLAVMPSRQHRAALAKYPPAPVPPDAAAPSELAAAARTCTACPLYREATQTVFGVGPAGARVMLVGEQPGNEEDRAGLPFVGPAGALLDRALAEAGLDRADVYLTNAVKHFKFVVSGKRRLHQKPRGLEIAACSPWLQAELRVVRPTVLVALGATAAQALFGSRVSVQRDRGRPIASPHAPRCFVTYHPSAALRAIRPEDRARIRADLTGDLRLAAAALETRPSAPA